MSTFPEDGGWLPLQSRWVMEWSAFVGRRTVERKGAEMGGLWVQLLIAVIGGAVGSAATLGASARRRRTIAEPVPAIPVRAAPTAPGLDRWLHELQRCEQAVHRAAQAVDSVSSTTARLDLRSVVRRMDAELPSVLALVELGRGLDAGGRDESARVLRQLDDAATRFGTITDQVLEAVVDLVATPDLDRVHRQVATLREQFPLQRPLSALLANRESGAQPLVSATG
jgi:hypothetical protein